MLGRSHMFVTGSIMTGSLVGSYSVYTMSQTYQPEDYNFAIQAVFPILFKLNDLFAESLKIDWSKISEIPTEVNTFLGFPMPIWLTTTLYLASIILLASIASLLPDIDSPTSILGRHVKWFSSVVPHRTYTHTIWAILLILIPAIMYNITWLTIIGYGYFLHVWEDSYSKQGIAWIYPITQYRIYPNGAVVKHGFKPIFYYRTGKGSEYVVVTILGVLWLKFLYDWMMIVTTLLQNTPTIIS